MDVALARYSEDVLGPVVATLDDDRPFRETLDCLIDFTTREETPEVPAGCLFAKMRSFRWRLGPVTGAHIDTLRGRQSCVAAHAWTVVPRSATTVVMSTQSLRDVRDHFSGIIDRVEHQHERVLVTRHGKPAAVILSPEDLAQLQETIDAMVRKPRRATVRCDRTSTQHRAPHDTAGRRPHPTHSGEY